MAEAFPLSSLGRTVGTNLNAVLEIRNSSGSVVATADPDNSYGASLATSLPLGDYTLSVRNNGEYGRVGQYTLVGEVDEDNDDLVPNNFGRLAPLGSLITRSTGNTAKINFAHDVDVFSTQLAPGQTISAIITPSNPTSALEAGWTGDANNKRRDWIAGRCSHRGL